MQIVMYIRTSKSSNKLHVKDPDVERTHCGRSVYGSPVEDPDGWSMCRICLKSSENRIRPLQKQFSYRGIHICNPSIYPHKITGFSTGESVIAGRKFPHIDFGAGIGIWLINKRKDYEHELHRLNKLPNLLSSPNRLA